MISKYTTYLSILLLQLVTACSHRLPDSALPADQKVRIWPDYTETSVPVNIAPLNFRNENERAQQTIVLFENKKTAFTVSGKRHICIPAARWKELLETSEGDSISITLYDKQDGKWFRYAPFRIAVAEPVDEYLAYRLIEPGYELWNQMGIYQRKLSDFEESAIIENRQTAGNCINCHSFCNRDPRKMMFHMRQTFPGTLLIDGNRIEKLNTETEQTISALVYPSWHPSGRFIAFSVNQTKQAFHSNDRNRVEVFDEASDVVVYDVEKKEVFTTALLTSPTVFETFPTFSPDGKQLFFCAADRQTMPDRYDSVRYNLCRISFDPETRTFGDRIDTLYHAGQDGASASFPRVSPDGKRLLYTRSGYGNFSIWHKDADLWMIDLESGRDYPLTVANSPDVESYHSWSSNSRWIVFSSRRDDGLFTRPYIAYIDLQGVARKPFLLPQENPDMYHHRMKSFNIPEFVSGKIEIDNYEISRLAKNSPGANITFKAP